MPQRTAVPMDSVNCCQDRDKVSVMECLLLLPRKKRENERRGQDIA